ncbi:MAG: glycine zipper family protein [Chloroflexi bacterium]|nr:glycine zipper family protein [Chloroflexota bacterium]
MDQKSNDEQKRPSKFYQNRGTSLGVALGLIFGAAFNQIGIGLVLGIAAGTAIGRTLELQAHKKTNQE